MQSVESDSIKGMEDMICSSGIVLTTNRKAEKDSFANMYSFSKRHKRTLLSDVSCSKMGSLIVDNSNRSEVEF
jgi:hypothetical protein